jgi:cell division septation protein DedD
VIYLISFNREELEATNVLVWQKDNLGEGTTIVVLDEGFKPYKYMEDNVEVMLFGYSSDKKDMTATGHGTGVMSTGYELAPKARVIFMPFNEVRSEQKHKMIDWIVDHKDEIDAITMSMTWTPMVGRKYFDRLQPLGIPFFVASGNDGEEDGVDYPANEPFTIAVGSGYNNRTMPYSNGGPELICVTPLIHGYNSRGEAISRYGTSFSTPFASYATLLYCSWRRRNGLPKLTQKQCVEWIKENALDFVSTGDRSLFRDGFDYESGWGMFRLPPVVPAEVRPNPIPPVIETPTIPEPPKPPVVEQPAPTPPTMPEVPVPGKFYKVQVGAFGVKDNCIRLLEELREKGFSVYMPPKDADGLYRVQCGAFINKANADDLKKKLIAEGYEDAFIVYK